jgi:DNA-binding transcriptional LysR family regulator
MSRGRHQRALLGLVRITATPSLAEIFLIPRLAALQHRYPGLDLEVLAERRPVSLQRHQADIALRLGRPEGGELLARCVGRITYHFYAAPVWRDRLKKGIAPLFVGFDEGCADFPEALWLARRFRKDRLAFRCNNQIGQIAAARAGCGIALLPRFLAAGDTALVEVRLAETPSARELWLLTRRHVRNSPQTRVVADFLVDMLRRERALLEGE